MQDRNDMLEILNAKLGAFDDLAKEPMPDGATSRTIGLFPKKGEVVKLRGLDFQVRFANDRTGELRLALVSAPEQTNEAEQGRDTDKPAVSKARERHRHGKQS